MDPRLRGDDKKGRTSLVPQTGLGINSPTILTTNGPRTALLIIYKSNFISDITIFNI